MKRNKFFMLIIVAILVLSLTVTSNTSNYDINTSNTASQARNSKIISPSIDIDTAQDLGEGPAIINHVSNSEFDVATMDGIPEGYDTYSFAGIYKNYTAYYDENVNSGSYALLLEAGGNGQNTGSNQFYRYFPTSGNHLNLSENPILSFSAYLDNPNINSGSEIYLRIQIRDNLGDSKYLFYYLSSSQYYNNLTNARYILNSSLDQWHDYSFDLNADYAAVFGSTAGLYVYNIFFFTEASRDELPYTKLVLDDLMLENSTYTDFVPDGGFETGLDTINWYPSTRETNTYIRQTTEAYNGNYALNISSMAWDQNVYSDAYYGFDTSSLVERQYVTRDITKISFYWKLEQTKNIDDNQGVYLAVYFQNTTFSGTAFIWLGNQGITWSNNSQSNYAYYYLNSPSFGTEDQWVYEEIDVYDLMSTLNYSSLYISGIEFDLYLGNHKNSSIELLVDSLGLYNYATVDPGFEIDNFDTGSDPVGTWDSSASQLSDLSRSSHTHSGNWSAHINLDENEYYYLSREVRPDTIDPYYLDLWWKVNETAVSTDSLVTVNFISDEGDFMYYVLAMGSDIFLSNSSNSVYYLVDAINQTGIWVNLFRDISGDIQAGFDSDPFTLDRIELYVSTGSGETISVFFDDVNFAEDTHSPIINTVNVLGSPVYYQQTIINAEVNDSLSQVATVTLFHNNGSGWDQTTAVNIENDLYQMIIPVTNYGTVIAYYIEAVDNAGNRATDDNGGANYSLTIGDDIQPLVSILSPLNNSQITGTMSIDILANDVGSDVDAIDLLLDGSPLVTLMNGITTYELNTRTLNNGVHSLSATVFDSASNERTAEINVITNNDLIGPVISDPLLNPTIPIEGEETAVFISVSDESNVVEVNLYTSVDGVNFAKDDMNNTGQLYNAYLPALNQGETIFFYIEAIDSFDQTALKGSETNPFILNIPETTDKDAEGIDAILQQASDLYQQYEYFAGAASVLLLFGLIRLVKWRRGKKT